MATQIYRSEQSVFYADAPTIYYGWSIAWAGGDYSNVYPFPSREQQRKWVAHVANHFGAIVGDHSVDDLAAALAMAEWGDNATDRESAFTHAQMHFMDILGARRWEVAIELACDFDVSGEPLKSEEASADPR